MCVGELGCERSGEEGLRGQEPSMLPSLPLQLFIPMPPTPDQRACRNPFPDSNHYHCRRRSHYDATLAASASQQPECISLSVN